MENPSRRTLRNILWLLTGVAIGLGAGAIKIDEMRHAAAVTAAANAQQIAGLKAEIDARRIFFFNETQFYRRQLGLRRTIPTPTDVADGMTCSEAFQVPGQDVTGVRSWKPRADGNCYAEDAR
jgi:hypothetical protein